MYETDSHSTRNLLIPTPTTLTYNATNPTPLTPTGETPSGETNCKFNIYKAAIKIADKTWRLYLQSWFFNNHIINIYLSHLNQNENIIIF